MQSVPYWVREIVIYRLLCVGKNSCAPSRIIHNKPLRTLKIERLVISPTLRCERSISDQLCFWFVSFISRIVKFLFLSFQIKLSNFIKTMIITVIKGGFLLHFLKWQIHNVLYLVSATVLYNIFLLLECYYDLVLSI